MKHRFIKIILLNVGLFFAILTNAQTHLGSWIVATDYSYYDPNVTCTSEFYELQFTTTGINTVLLGNASGITGFNNRLDIATGSGYYSTDNSPACYVLVNNDRISYYNSNNLLSHNTFWDNMNHTTMVIPKPGSSTNYCAIYAASGIAKGSQGDMWISVISNPGGQLGVDESHSFAFYKPDHTDWCMTSELAGDRHIYFTTNPEGLCRVSVNEVLADNETLETLVAPDTYGLAGHFGAHEIELKQHANTVDIAWTTLESSGDLYRVIYNFATNSSQVQVHHLNQGVIAGIEYDQYENDIIYVSCEAGIVKYNFDTETSTTLTSSGNYKHTCLQTAPDGYIYGVRDQGGYLGRIDQQTATFTPEAYHFNYTGYGSDPDGYLTNKRIVDNQVYFLLPKHDVLSSLAEPVAVSCPGMSDGQVTIYAGGGTPDYTLSCFLGTTEITGFYYNNANYTFYHDALSEGFYTYTLYDARGMQAKGSFEIKSADDYYDYPDTKFEVSASRSLPDADMPLNTYSFEEGIHISSGATLTINQSIYEFGRNAKIILEPGATLELVGSTLTNHEECNLQWQGVEVQGNSDLPQQPELINGIWVYHQARLIMQNATIENAIEAVGLLKRNDNNEVLSDKSGGIVVANNSHFINNVNSVHFILYKNINYNAIAEIGNASYFSNCTFELNENYIPDYTFYKHVDLYGVKGVEFRGCTFTNTATNGVSQYNLGIHAIESGFTVEARCIQSIEPCPEEDMDKSSFNGFYNAIRATSERPTDKTFIVTNSEFENNAIGIFVSMVNLSTIVDNDFKVGYSTPGKVYDECKGLVNSLGIDMQFSSGFAIENNTFIKPATSTGEGDFAGIRVYACPSDVDVIYNNTFDNLTYGNYAQGTNRYNSDWDWTGVEYQCNKNGESVFNWEDFMVTYIENAADGRIKTDHGSPEIASGNTFSKSAHWHIHNEGTQKIDWYFCPTCPDEEPTLLYSPEDPTLIHPYPSVSANTCPEHYSGGGSVKLSANDLLVKELDFAQNLSDYNSVESLIESLKDGGDTYSELSDIQSAIPDDMWSLRSQLLGDSPHLTKEVLMAMSDRTDVFPDDVLFEILAANPDELSKDTLISYLENKENPLPDYMIDILKQLVGGVTYKTILLRERTDYYEAKTQAAQDILRSILNDSILDVALYRNWLDNLGGLNADKQLVASYFSEGDSSSALALLNMIPSLYALQGGELAEFNDFQSLLLLQEGWKQSGKHLTELDSLDLVTLYDYAVNSTGSARSTAQNILTYAENTHFCDCMHSDDSTNAKMGGASLGNSLNRIYGLEITATPNPARVYVAFNYQLPESKPEGIISVSDLAGKEIQRFVVSGKQGQQVWDIRNVKSGVYLYTLTSGGLQKTGKVVIN